MTLNAWMIRLELIPLILSCPLIPSTIVSNYRLPDPERIPGMAIKRQDEIERDRGSYFVPVPKDKKGDLYA